MTKKKSGINIYITTNNDIDCDKNKEYKSCFGNYNNERGDVCIDLFCEHRNECKEEHRKWPIQI